MSTKKHSSNGGWLTMPNNHRLNYSYNTTNQNQ
ncbi:hypothetical protein GA0116948_102327 [Chitinophaga costaii]|uniref:Uncharacterized protein n=1 Tax=Chitinophaga costaii TaxID=1335309 RepID=A0A1C4AXA6_9BACT|nr:hypothetical protein GA0116948_102327 [Chitinophaga costaii]